MTTTDDRPAHTSPDHLTDEHSLEAAWHEGYTAGHHAAANARPAADVYQPTTRPWRHIQAGDVFLGRGAALWQVAAAEPRRGAVRVHAWHAGREHVVDVDPDTTVDILVQRPERDALELLHEQLGAQLTMLTGGTP